MPDTLQKTIEIIFSGTDELSSITGKIGNDLERLGGKFQDFGAPFQAGVEKALLLEAAILGIGTAALTARANLESESARMVAALGLPTEKAEEFEEVAKRVYGTGFGGNLEESFAAVTFAAQKFTDETTTGIEGIVNKGNSIKNVFGVDVSESLSSVKTLMTNFGLSSEEAFNFIVAGYQKGINSSGDFLESINEYATQFANGGADAGQFFSVLETGFQEGLLGTDKAADAFKEFRVRILDGSKTTQEALDQLGLGQPFLDSLSSGKITAIDAFGTIIQKLNETEDRSVVMQAGVGLLGTQFEDLGTKAALSISTAATSLDDLQGKINSIEPTEQLATKFQSMVNTIKLAILDDKIWDGISKDLGDRFDGFKEDFLAAWKTIDASDFRELTDSFDDLLTAIGDMFAAADFDLSSVEGIQEAIQNVIDTVQSVNQITTGIVEFVTPIIEAISNLIQKFNELEPETQQLAGYLSALGASFGTIGVALATGGAILGGISTFAGAFASGGVLYTAVSATIAILTGPLGLVAAMAAVSAAAVGFSLVAPATEAERMKIALEAELETLEKLADKLDKLPAEAQSVEIFVALDDSDYQEAERLINEALAKEKELQIKAEVDQKEFDDFWADLVKLGKIDPAELEIIADTKSLDEANKKIDEIAKEKEIKLTANTEPATKTLTYWTETQGEVTIEVPVEAKGVDEISKKIKDLPSEKIIEIELQGEIDKELARIETQAETLQDAMEFKAEVDIAEIEGMTKQVEAAFASADNTISSTGSTLTSALSTLSGADDLQTKWEALEILNAEQEYREESLEMQKQLNKAQIDYMNARTKALAEGDVGITISSDGLEPALKMIMFEIIKYVQIEGSSELSEFLLGIT